MPSADRDRQHRHLERCRQTERAGLEALDSPGAGPLPLGKDHDDVARLEQPDRLPRRRRVGRVDARRKGAQAPDEPVEQGDLEEPVPRHVIDPAPDRDAHERWIGVGLMVRRDDDGPGGGNVLGAGQLETEVGAAEAVKAGPREIQEGRPHEP